MKRSNIEEFFKRNEKRQRSCESVVNTDSLTAVDQLNAVADEQEIKDTGIGETSQTGDTDILGPPSEASQETRTVFNVADLSVSPLDPPSQPLLRQFPGHVIGGIVRRFNPLMYRYYNWIEYSVVN